MLVACEESQAVCDAFRALGHEAYSCDLLPTSGKHPEWHIQADALQVVRLGWDMVIAFPPCTDLAVSGARWFEQKQRNGTQQMSIGFFLAFTALDNIPRVAIENPVGIMSSIYRKPDQIIQPWQFGHPETKATCLMNTGCALDSGFAGYEAEYAGEQTRFMDVETSLRLRLRAHGVEVEE